MKFALSLLGALVVATAIGTPAHADGPWCAFYDGRFGGASNCGFHTYEQCLATISGVGGWCQPNTMYAPRRPAAPLSRLSLLGRAGHFAPMGDISRHTQKL